MMMKATKLFEKGIIYILLFFMAGTVLFSCVELGYELVRQLFSHPFMLLGIKELQSIFGYFFMVLIGLELLETIRTYLEDNRIHVEVVFLVAMIAVARKIIIIDYEHFKSSTLFGMATIIIALTVGYYLMKKINCSSCPNKIKREDED